MVTSRKWIAALVMALASVTVMAQERKPFEGIMKVQGFINQNMGKKNAGFTAMMSPDGMIIRIYKEGKMHEIDSLRRMHTIYDTEKHLAIRYFELLGKGISMPHEDKDVKSNIIVKYKAEPTGEQDEVLGHPCDKWLLKIKMNQVIKGMSLISGGVKMEEPTQEVWISREYLPMKDIYSLVRYPGLIMQRITKYSSSATFHSYNMYTDEKLVSIQEQPVNDDMFDVPADMKIKSCKSYYAFTNGCLKLFKENQKVMEKMGIKAEELKTQFKTNEEFEE